MLAVFGVIPLIVGFGGPLLHELFDSMAMTALVVCVGVAAVLVQVVIRWNAFQQIQQRDVKWYRSHYPGYVKGRTVRCVVCSGEDVRPRSMPPPVNMREHYCGGCGQVLYYSPGYD